MKTLSTFFRLWLLILISVVSTGEIVAQEVLIRTPFVPPQSEELIDGDVVLIRENPEIAKLQREIDENADRLDETNKEIEELSEQLQVITDQKESLNKELETITLTNRRNEAQIRATEQQIQTGEASVKKLDTSIETNAKNLETLQDVLVQNYQRINELELKGFEATLFSDVSFAELLRRIEETSQLSKNIENQFRSLETEVHSLGVNKNEIIHERQLLGRRKRELEDRKQIYQFSIEEKERLVNTTKNNESNYQRLLSEKIKERLALQQELFAYESQIEYLRDPDSLPSPKLGLLQFPFEGNPRVTQAYGRTAFSIANAHRYGRDTHDGLDFGLHTGAKIFSSADGVVIGTGNTDLVPRCQSWGKWVAVEHPFGLSTLYAHLSFIKVRLGQKVTSGELLGYSGNTGFSTGPHLHFGVYDSRGFKIIPYEQISSSSRCRGLIIPVSAENARIDPGLYLP